MTQYFSDLQDLWQELDLFFEDDSTCAECSIKQVFDFLAGLNRNLDEVRGRVVAREPFPSTEDAFAEVRREEVRRKVMLTDDIPAPPSAPEVSALVSKNFPSNGQHHSDQRTSKQPWCDHYNRPAHTRKRNDGCAYQTQSDQRQIWKL